MSTLVDVLVTEQLVALFRDARRKAPTLNAVLVPDPLGDGDVTGGGGTAVRIATEGGGSLLVTARRIAREVGDHHADVACFVDLVGYDWFSRDLSEKVRLQAERRGRVFLLLREAREVVLDGLGPAVFPLMAYLGKVLEIRSQKILLRRLDDHTVALVTRCLDAAARGPFFGDGELAELFDQDRRSLGVVAALWSRMNLASPDLGRTVVGVLEMLLRRRGDHPDAWDSWVQATPGQVEAALAAFRSVVEGRG